MKRFIAFVSASLFAAHASATEYINGWTAETSNAVVRGCLDTGINKQMQMLYNSGQLSQTSTKQQVDSARAYISDGMSFVCACSQKRYMKDYKFENAAQISERPNYVKQVFTECAQEWQKKQGS